MVLRANWLCYVFFAVDSIEEEMKEFII
jgi:hypothetical protein